MAGYSKVELAQEAFWRKCKADPAFFFRNYWYIQHPEQGAILFDLFGPQESALEVFRRDRFVITLKSRQIGWTTLCAGYAFWLTFFHEDRAVIFLSKGEREAKDILAKVKYGYKRIPDWMRSRGPRLERDNQQEFPLDNGSLIESLPSKSDPARGKTVYLVIVDEWAFLENPDDAWASIEPITDVGGRVIGLSTANGWGNFFHEMWVKAETGVSNFTPLFEPWTSREDRDDEWYAVKKASLPEWQLYQEYPRTPEEAFIKSGNPFFDVDKLAMINVEEPRVGVIRNVGDLTFVEQPRGELSLWELPILGDTYVIGADVAEGLEWGDYSSAHVIHLKTGKVVAHWHGHTPPDEFGATVLNDLGRFYNTAIVGCEVNNHGLTTNKYLKDWARYPNIFFARIIDERTRRETKKIGWTTTIKTRPKMLDDLAMVLRTDDLDLRDRFTIAELRTFIRDDKGKLRGSPYDDRVISLAIANQMREYAHQYVHVDRAIPYMSLKWWEQTTKEHDNENRPIGYHNRRGARV